MPCLSGAAHSAPAEYQEQQEEKKQTSLWRKKYKIELRKLVVAMILIEPSTAKRLGFKCVPWFGAIR